MGKSNNKVLKKFSDRLIVILISALLVVISVSGILEKFDFRVYDMLLSLYKNPETSSELLFVEADDDSLKEMGPWPWPRNIMGNVMFRLKEFGAETAVFDIEYLSKSQPSFDQDMFNSLSEGIESGAISAEDAKDELRGLLFDNDDYFARSLQFFGNTWLTINVLNISEESAETREYAKKRCLYDFVKDENDLIYKDNRYNERDAIRENENYARNENIEYTDAYEDLTHGFSPALNMFIRHSKGAGFTNVDIDSDGTRRRIQLLNKYPEGYAAQLAFAPLLKKLDARSVIRDGSSIIVSGVKLDEDSGRQDIKIPLDEHGRMMINWKHASYGETFRHQKIYHLYYLDQLENSFADNSLILLNAASSIDPDAETNTALASISELAELYDQLADYKKFLLSKCEGYDEEGNTIGEGITDEEYKEYFDARKTYFTMADEFIHSDAFDLLNAKLDSRKKAFSKDDFSLLKETLSDLQESMTFAVADYNDLYNTIEKEYKGSFCIIGNTGSATTDLGTTPFNRRYPNVGTHANMYNTIVNREFIVPAPWWSGVAAAFILAFLLAAFSQKRKVFAINIAGVCTLLLITGGIIALMAFLGVYVPAIAPVLIVLLSFISIEILHFVRSEKDKSFLKHAFATYLNPKSVDELVAHPERLSLGGDQKHMTALFSDIKGFSSFSEKVTPIKLVNVLKTYLGDMSDCVLDAGGTIDKYIGDSIVSFFGAPTDLPNSAWSACCAAIRMKQAEEKYNKINIASGFIPQELYTRIGINTGEMVVGNMGTDKKFNYTIMGNDVNLASRLEGVNKIYKSWILCSEYTWNEANTGDNIDKIVARRFDRVRVVGIEKPVQLYNIVGFRNELTSDRIASVELFDQAIDVYLARQFKKAEKMFREADALAGGDESAIVYAERCAEYAQKGVAEGWDGVLTMKTK